MTRVLFLVPAVVLLLGAGEPTTDLDQFQGNWRFLEYHSDRVEVTKERLKAMKVHIKGNTLVVSDGTKEEKLTFTLDPKQTPRAINLREGKQPELPGIYELKGDTLRIVTAGTKRPEAFPPKLKGGYTLLVLQRE